MAPASQGPVLHWLLTGGLLKQMFGSKSKKMDPNQPTLLLNVPELPRPSTRKRWPKSKRWPPHPGAPSGVRWQIACRCRLGVTRRTLILELLRTRRAAATQ